MGKVVGIRFQRGGKVYDFDAGHFVLSMGDQVIVETEHGLAMGTVSRPPRQVDDGQRDPEAPPLKSVYRLATDEDQVQLDGNFRLEKEAQRFCQDRIAARKLDMNLVKVECLFDRSKIIFYFTAEGRLDFRELVRDLVARYRTRVELRQIGVRHEAKLLGGLGSCGRELCCATFLKDFEPVSVKMAKEQNLSLNPTKISGLCGRLMCCLTYEYQTYQHLKKDMPKLGKRLTLADGNVAKVTRQNVLGGTVTLHLLEGGEITCTPPELQKLLEGDDSQPSAPAENPQTESAAAKDKPRGRRKKK